MRSLPSPRPSNLTADAEWQEWLSWTSIQIHIHRAFGWEPPQYAHACMLASPEHQPLHKRNLDDSLGRFRTEGADPQALLNFVALLGWSHSAQSDVMDLDALVKRVRRAGLLSPSPCSL